VHSIWIVSNRLSSRYLVRGFGFCDFNSPDISRRVRATRSVRMDGAIFVLQLNIEFIRPLMAGTNLSQRAVEVPLRRPFNVSTSLFTSNLDRVQ
jgi:hypothetical protein